MPLQGEEATRKLSREDDNVELRRLREAAKVASIYHRQPRAFRRSTHLTHVAHASLHFAQFAVASAIEAFHYIHHRVIENQRLQDSSIPAIPEERNPIFYIYPICMSVSLIFAALWLCKTFLVNSPMICLVGCFGSAGSLLCAGILEMKHVDQYIDITQVTDEQLLKHPVFIHNFIMCILSIVCMTLFLVQGWIFVDVVQWEKGRKSRSQISEGVQTTPSVVFKKRDSGQGEKVVEEPGELRPIASLDAFPTLKGIPRPTPLEEEPVVLYCCVIDCCRYIGREPNNPVHEFQVVHVL